MILKDQLVRFNRIYREMDGIYHEYAKSLGLSDSAFWILYCISERGEPITQRALCNDWFFTPQTVNSALKDMEKKQIIRLGPVPGNKKSKWIHLTPDGERLVAEVILPLMQAECDGFSALSEEECAQMFSLTERYAAMLRTCIGTIRK